jgi:hypothetical protein
MSILGQIFCLLKNGSNIAGIDLGRTDNGAAQLVCLIDPATGLPYSAAQDPLAVEREVVVTTYFCSTAFTGASVNDTITCTQVIDITNAPSTIAVIWRNQTTATDLAGAPSASNITLVASTALTNAQLRATPIPVSTPTPANPITGQIKISTNNVAVELPSATLSNGVIIKASTTNQSVIFVGSASVNCIDDGTGNGYPLTAGESISFAVLNMNAIYINGIAGDFISYAGN